LSEPVGVDGIEVVHSAGEMLKADHRGRALLPEAAKGETDIADVLELGWSGFTRVGSRHGRELLGS
jgi:hypothetical protein